MHNVHLIVVALHYSEWVKIIKKLSYNENHIEHIYRMHVALFEEQKTNIRPYIFASKRGFRKLSVHCGGRDCWRILKAIQLCQK